MRKHGHRWSEKEPYTDRYDYAVHFRRGFLHRIEVPTLADLVTADGEPSPWLRAVLSATPERALVSEIVPLDRKPFDLREGSYRPRTTSRMFIWLRTDQDHGDVQASVLPDPFWEFLTDDGRRNGWDTPELAVTALGAAVATLGRARQAPLPEPEDRT
jgi:hypothetical protein